MLLNCGLLLTLDQCSTTGVPSQGERCDANFYLLYEILFNDNKITIYYSNKLIMLCIDINCLISCDFEGINILVCRVESWILHGVSCWVMDTSWCAVSRKRLRNAALDELEHTVYVQIMCVKESGYRIISLLTLCGPAI
jgi:hypothetical protein